MRYVSVPLSIFLVSLLSACGQDSSALIHDEKSVSITQKPSDQVPPSVSANGFLGFVANAFEVEVDGVSYKDLEDFYTQELGRLPKKITDIGFGPSAKIQLEANIGFSDLWSGMQVFVASTGDNGFQGQGVVSKNGSFNITLPDAALDDTYKVRANKRIRLVITEGSTRTVYCYNFSAREQSVPYELESKPIILDKFETSLTRYDCTSSDQGNGLTLPKETSLSTAKLLAPGAAKLDVLAKLGSLGLSLSDSQTWCWDARQSKDAICATSYIGPCSCSVSFDSQGHLLSVNNLKAEHLDVLQW